MNLEKFYLCVQLISIHVSNFTIRKSTSPDSTVRKSTLTHTSTGISSWPFNILLRSPRIRIPYLVKFSLSQRLFLNTKQTEVLRMAFLLISASTGVLQFLNYCFLLQMLFLVLQCVTVKNILFSLWLTLLFSLSCTHPFILKCRFY